MPKNESLKIASKYNKEKNVIMHQHIKIYRTENLDVSNSEYLRVGFRIESKPSYLEKKLAKFPSFFHW
jgi:hypothetical protein